MAMRNTNLMSISILKPAHLKNVHMSHEHTGNIPGLGQIRPERGNGKERNQDTPDIQAVKPVKRKKGMLLPQNNLPLSSIRYKRSHSPHVPLHVGISTTPVMLFCSLGS